MQKDVVIVTKTNVTPEQQICLVQTDTTQEPTVEICTEIDYDTLSAPEKVQYDDCMAMLLSKIPA